MAPERLLVLDDEPAVGRMLELLARDSGHEASVTTEPRSFFRAVDDWCPTLIALDLIMPEMDGVEVIQHLAERRCAARIILTSGVGDRVLDAASRSATEHGLQIAGVLSKPFTPAAFQELLASAAGAGTDLAIAAAEPAGETGPEGVTPGDLQRALATYAVRTHYQPKIRCDTGALDGFEALARWTHPCKGVIEPALFIPLAEQSGLIGLLTTQVLDESLAWLAGGRTLGGRSEGTGPLLAVNLSPRMLRDERLVEGLAGRCRKHGVEPSRLVLEVTETSAMEDPVSSLALLTRLRMKGFQLSIDDFGTGYSSMQQLVRLPFSELKIDRSFVLTALRSAESRNVIRSIVDLGHSLGLQVTAEGVEDEATMGFVEDSGCDLAQGYHIGRPMPAQAVPEWMAGRPS